MKFELMTVKTLYPKEECPALEKLGFTFHEDKGKTFGEGFFWIKGRPTIEITTLGELMKFIEEHGEIVVNGEGPTIEIYNDYR